MVNKTFFNFWAFVAITTLNHLIKSNEQVDHLKSPEINRALAKLLYNKLFPEFRNMVEKLKCDNFRQTGLPQQIMLFGDYGTGVVDYVEAIAHESGKEYFIISASFLASEFSNFGEEKIKQIIKGISSLGKPVILIIKDLNEICKKDKGFDNQKNKRAFKILINEIRKESNIYLIGVGYYENEAPIKLKKCFPSSFIVPKRRAEEKKEILEIYLQKFSYECDSSCKRNLLEKTKNAEPRDIQVIVQQAALLALRRNPKNPRILTKDFQQPLADYEEYEKEKNKPEEWTLERGVDLAYRLTMTACLIGTITNLFPCWGPNKK